MVLSKWLRQNNLSFTVCWSEQNDRWIAYSKDIRMKPTGSNFIGLGEGVAQAIDSFVAQASLLAQKGLLEYTDNSNSPKDIVLKGNLKSFSFIEQMMLKLSLNKKVQDMRKSLIISTSSGQDKWSARDKQTGLTREYQYLSEAIVANFNANLASINSTHATAASPSNNNSNSNTDNGNSNTTSDKKSVNTTKQKP